MNKKKYIIVSTIFLLLILGLLVKSIVFNSKGNKVAIIEEKLPFPGYLYRPNAPGPFPAIVLLHGSYGGNGDFWYYPAEKPKDTGEDSWVPKVARELSEKGFVALALCYFDCQHHKGFDHYPPDELANIDIKSITGEAIKWLKSSPFVGGKKVGLWGASRGAEQAILLASLIESQSDGAPDAIVALSPASYIASQFSKTTAEAIINDGIPHWPSKPAWRYGDHIPTINSDIKIESYKKPLLITYFTKDPVWRPSANIQKIINRYKESRLPFLHKKIEKNQFDKVLLDEIKASEIQTMFLNYNFRGHVIPNSKREPEAFDLHKEVVVWFLKKYLKD